MRARGMTGEAALLFVPIGDNPARLFAVEARERACRVAQSRGLVIADAPDPSSGALLASMAYSWDPAWLDILKDRPKTALVLAGKPVIISLPQGEEPDAAVSALESGILPEGYEAISEEAELRFHGFRKGKRPFVLPLDGSDPAAIERAIYDSTFEEITDFLTLYLLRRPVFHLTRAAARSGIPAIAVTLLGAAFCLLASFLFWRGIYWPGILAGLVFIILERLEDALARCTASASKLGIILGQGIAVVYPPFWWWAWLHGLEAYGRALEPVYATMILILILGGYLGELVIEILSMRRFNGMEIHIWRPLDSRFRLITAGPVSNLAILAGALLFARPDTGLVMVACWTLVSLIFHAVRLAQMTERRARGEMISSWLSA